MNAIPNKVLIGSEEEPILTFENDKIKEVIEDIGTSPIGDELFIDQFMPTVGYQLFLRYRILPKDVDLYQGILSSDGKLLGSKYNYDIRNIPYGTPVRFYSDNRITGIFYCEKVERVNKELFKLTCISAIGMMNRQRHHGGIYTGQSFETVLREIVGGEEYEYQIEPDVASLQVYGWLPYTTRRRNLHQLLISYGVTITRSDTGGMLFTFVNTVQSYEIPPNRVFEGGSVQYGEPASRVEITEHSYHYLPTTEYEQLFDTQGEDLAETLVIFDHPVYEDSIRVLETEEGGNLVITSKGTNFAMIRGSGIIIGQPYVHNTKLMIATNEEALTEKIVIIEGATLITMANSDNALARIANYYFNATVVTQDIKVEDERPGRRYDVLNPFRETTTGFLSKMLVNTTSFRRATCEFVTDYIPIASGASFGNRVILEPNEEAVWNIPEVVYEKDVQQVRCVLISKGEDGASGGNGEDGDEAFDTTIGTGGRGGVGGKGGRGGRIYSVTIDCENLAFIRYGKTDNGDTYIRAGDNYYSSAYGQRSITGFTEMFTGAVFALSGIDGINGANGGNGGLNVPVGATPVNAVKGNDIENNGILYKGGKGARFLDQSGASLGIHSNLTVKFGGGGGGGAAVGADGHDSLTGYNFEEDRWNTGGDGADGADAVVTSVTYGSGGNGGHGGGGGGGGSTSCFWNHEYSTIIGYGGGNEGGKGGNGGKGTSGFDGCIILYY